MYHLSNPILQGFARILASHFVGEVNDSEEMRFCMVLSTPSIDSIVKE